MTTNLDIALWAEMSIERRNPFDADVRAVCHAVRHLDSNERIAKCERQEPLLDEQTYWTVVARCILAGIHDDSWKKGA